MSTVPKCRVVTVHLFRGDRGAIGQSVRKALDDQKHGQGPGPSLQECLLYAGHMGVSVDSEPDVILGFNPDLGNTPLWLAMENLRNRMAYPGIVTDDTNVFAEARTKNLQVLTFAVALSPASFRTFNKRLTAERKKSRYSYGFPDGNGDCNCTTWLERLGLPLLTGRMNEVTAVTGVAAQVRRRFGLCR